MQFADWDLRSCGSSLWASYGTRLPLLLSCNVLQQLVRSTHGPVIRKSIGKPVLQTPSHSPVATHRRHCPYPYLSASCNSTSSSYQRYGLSLSLVLFHLFHGGNDLSCKDTLTKVPPLQKICIFLSGWFSTSNLYRTGVHMQTLSRQTLGRSVMPRWSSWVHQWDPDSILWAFLLERRSVSLHPLQYWVPVCQNRCCNLQ